jgi:hypothetical protein
MAFLGDRVFDNGLGVFNAEANALHLCSAQATTFAQATSTFTLGNKATPTISAPQAGSPNGRQVTVSEITDGSVTGTGTATHYSIVDTSNSRLLASGSLSASQAITNGNEFRLTSFTIRIPAPA